MRIGFDAKRAFHNRSGLGNYARTLITALAASYPEDQFDLFTPKPDTNIFTGISGNKNVHFHYPPGLLNQLLPSRWRSYGITSQLNLLKADVYHGLSNELPQNISAFKGKKLVTIHDLIFMKQPGLYPAADRKIYEHKSRSACKNADLIIATSKQTAEDIKSIYGVNAEKIQVVYQSCDPLYFKNEYDNWSEIKNKFKLPDEFILSVGTLETRKNQDTAIKALSTLKEGHLVLVGRKTNYYSELQKIITEKNLSTRVTFLENVSASELRALYKQALFSIYISFHEGFGIPVLESLASGTPVIASQGGCLEEVGGPGALYVDPSNMEQVGQTMTKLLSASERKVLSEAGKIHAQDFLPEKAAAAVMQLYRTS